jgi:hypothetical protein
MVTQMIWLLSWPLLIALSCFAKKKGFKEVRKIVIT